jgi:hypothetical protein
MPNDLLLSRAKMASPTQSVYNKSSQNQQQQQQLYQKYKKKSDRISYQLIDTSSTDTDVTFEEFIQTTNSGQQQEYDGVIAATVGHVLGWQVGANVATACRPPVPV